MALRGIALIGIALVGLLMVYLFLGKRPVKPAVNVPGMADPSTPLAQHGFVLTLVQRDNRSNSPAYPIIIQTTSPGILGGAVTLWIRTPWMPASSRTTVVDFARPPFSVQARTSLGDVIKLDWTITGNSQGQKILRVYIPSGYSNAVAFMDVTVTDKFMHHATWRINRFPPMRHVLSADNVRTSRTDSGFRFTARAWRLPPNPNKTASTQVAVGDEETVVGNASGYKWDFQKTAIEREWETYFNDFFPGEADPVPLGKKPATIEDFTTWITAYPLEQHYLQIRCEIRQYTTCEERVTFHNLKVRDGSDAYLAVASPQMLTTPSGVTIALIPPPTGEQPAGGPSVQDRIFRPGVFFWLAVKPYGTHQRLRTSPLAAKFNKPVYVSVGAPNGLRVVTSGGGANSDQYIGCSLKMAPPAGGLLKDLTITVTHRVNLQVIPTSLTVPLLSDEPADIKSRKIAVRPSV